LQFYVSKLRNIDASKPPQSLEFFFKSFDKGSKPFRFILAANQKNSIEHLNTVVSFCNIISLPMPNIKTLKGAWSEWNNSYYPNRCREFLYKFRNNTLGVNARVCKFVQEIKAECSICVANSEPLPINSETFLHVFFECNYTQMYRDTILTNFFPELRGAVDSDKKNCGFLD